MPSGSRVSPEPIRLVPVSVSNAQLLGGQVAATPELSIKLPPAATLHELWCEFGDTVNGAKTKDEAATKEAKQEAARWSPKTRRLSRSGSHHSHGQLLFYHLTSGRLVLLRTFPRFFSDTKKPGCTWHRDQQKDAAP